MQVCPSGCCAGCWHAKQPKGIEGGTPGETLKCAQVEPRGHRNVAEQLLLRRSVPTLSDPNLGRSHTITLRSGDTRHLMDEGNWPKRIKMLEVGSPAWKNLLWKKPSHPETAFCLRFGAVGVGNWGVPWAVGTTRCVVGWQYWCEWDRWGGSRTASTAGGALMGWGGCGAGRDLW